MSLTLEFSTRHLRVGSYFYFLNKETNVTFLALLLSLHCVPVLLQLFFSEIAKRVGGERASILFILSDESLIGRRT